MTTLRSLSIYVSSIRYLRPGMVYWRVHRAVKGLLLRLFMRRSSVSRGSAPPELPAHAPVALSSRYRCEDIDLDSGRMSFLREVLVLPAECEARIAAVAGMPLLWQFHYHYHDWLVALLEQEHPPALDAVLGRVAIWEEDHPLHAPGSRTAAWHPYVLSIRIEAWIRLHATLTAGASETDERASELVRGVDTMTRVLERNLEYGTRANHLLRNVKALILAGIFLRTRRGARSLRTGLRLLVRELREQLLDDGMHYERSPMYHASVLNDLVDIREALDACELLPAGLEDAIARMTAFLEASLHPDGEIPFFNDSTVSFTLSTADVLRHARDIMARFDIAPVALPPLPAAVDRPSRVSGLLFHRTDRLFVAFDAGDVGPDYQPGHAHCDTLSFELSWNGRRVVSDTGVFQYRESPERAYARSTAAHSTVRIDSEDQSEVWKSFRVGRRAHSLFIERREEAGCTVFQAAHDGYERLQHGLVHERAIIAGATWICVVDFLHGEGPHLMESILHLHPGWKVQRKGSGVMSVSSEGLHWTLHPLREDNQRMFDTEYYPAFGARLQRKSIVHHGTVTFPYISGYILAFTDERVAAHVDVPTASVTVNGVRVVPRLRAYRDG